MPSLSLKGRILLLSSGLIALLTVAMLAYVGVQANAFVNNRLQQDLRRAQDLAAAAERERLETLLLTASLVASFPDLKALLDTRDAATVRDFLLQYRHTSAGTELLIALDPAGRVIARTDSLTATPIPDVQRRWTEPAIARQSSRGVLEIDGGVYHAAVAPAEAAGALFGFVLAGAPVDDRYARQLSDATRSDIAVIGRSRLLGSTLRADQWPWKSTADWRSRFGDGPGPHTVPAAGETYVGAAATGSDPAITVVTLESRDRALAPYQRIQIGLVLLGVVAVLAGLAASAALARSVTAPVSRVRDAAQQIAAGNLDVRLDVPRRDEIGELAQAFNQMAGGLRERADMQKFVSQSTVAMIRGQSAAPGSERRTLTLFLSDLRDFTTWAETRSPEQAVRLLNDCFTLQASIVQRFGGDIDKYIGDALFAYFAGPDMALSAIRCAVEIHRAMDALPWDDRTGSRLSLGIGIVTGEVLVGSIGSADRLDYTAIGSNVNLCERLCSRAAPREILMNEATWLAVRDLVAAQPMEPAAMKGFSTPVPVYRMAVRSEQVTG